METNHFFKRCIVCGCLLAIGVEYPHLSHVGHVSHRQAILAREATVEQLHTHRDPTGFVAMELRRAVTDVTTSSGPFIDDRTKDGPIGPRTPRNYQADPSQPSDALVIWFAAQEAAARSASS